MKVSYVEGVAIYDDSELCVHIREGVGEALTGGCAGQPLSREIHAPRRKAWADWGAEAVGTSRRPHRDSRFGEAMLDPTRSETLCTHTSTLRGNREVSESSATLSAERIVKPLGVRR